MPDLLLPRLSPDAPIPATNSGQWDEKALSADELNRLANGLEVAANRNRSVSIDSIPDIWARPIFFKMALYAGTDNHFDAEIHRKIKGEWRAILAMLALNTMRNLNLTVDDVHLGHGGAAVRQIEQMLLQLAPEDSVTLDTTVPILPESDWKDIYVISYRDKPLAITSPTTLVAAAADYSAELNGQLTQPWSSDGIYLTDPINYLIADELSGLKQWLQDLLNSLKNFIPFNVQTNNETCRQLFAALQSYIDEVHNRLVEFHDMTPGITIVPANFNMSIGIFRFLNNEIQPPPATPNSSFVRLIPSPSREDSSPLLIISPKMLSDISRTRAIPKPRLFVWAGLTAVDINEYSMRNNRSNIGDVSISPAQWRRPEEFFTDKLVIISGADKFKGVFNARGSESLSTQNRSIILPLKTEILEYFEPKEIAARLQIESVNGSFKVTFEFPLSGNDDSGIVYTAQKIYEAKDIVFMASALPAIEIWPNFKRRGWKKYYLYYENSEAQNQTQTVGEDFLYVYPYAYGGNIAGDNTPNRGLANRYTARLSGFPEALICTTNWTDGGRKHAKLVESGLLLLNPPQNREAYFGVDWNVGIDFGTSSTMLYKRVNDNDPQPLNLQPNLFQITESGDLRNRTYNNFIPTRTDDQQSGSFLSIFQMLGNLKSGVPIRPLQDGNIFWLLSADGPEAKHFCGNNSSINVNLKWGIAPADKMKVAAYIQQICLQILAEAA